MKLTSITAYRDYKSIRGRTPTIAPSICSTAPRTAIRRVSSRRSRQELRLNGTLFNGKLDWLVGGFYANEDLTVRDNLRFGTQYGRFAACRVISGSALASFYSPTNTSCISPTGRAVLRGARPAVASPFGAAGPAIVSAFDRLDAISDKGTTLDGYNQNSRNYAFFTHNIFHVTDRRSI